MIIMCENRPSSVSQTELAERGTCGGGFGLLAISFLFLELRNLVSEWQTKQEASALKTRAMRVENQKQAR